MGDVVVTLSDRKLSTITLGVAGNFTAELKSYNNYYAFGFAQPGRYYAGTNNYLYGYNGKELDKEGMGGGGSTYDYGFRIYNPQIARFLSVDPLTKSYPWYTPYQFAGNMPIQSTDLDGLEEYHYSLTFNKQGQSQLKLTCIEPILDVELKWSWNWPPVKAEIVSMNTTQKYTVHTGVMHTTNITDVSGMTTSQTEIQFNYTSQEQFDKEAPKLTYEDIKDKDDMYSWGDRVVQGLVNVRDEKRMNGTIGRGWKSTPGTGKSNSIKVKNTAPQQGSVKFAQKVNTQKMQRHLSGTAPANKSYFKSVDDAQAVLDAYNSGKYKLISENVSQNTVTIEVQGIEGRYVNTGNPNGLPDLNIPTNKFMIQSSSAPKVVPVNPSK